MKNGPGNIHYKVASRTDIGRRREVNEDSLQVSLPREEGGARDRILLCVVADGMGGHAAGDVASRIATQTVIDRFRRSADSGTEKSLVSAVEHANLTILEKARDLDSPTGMGTTLVAAAIEEDRLVLANIGDSRAYLLRNAELRQLTTDHSWVQEELEAGRLNEEEAALHPRRNLITRALGLGRQVKVDVFIEELREEDILILCSDGLWGQIGKERLSEVLSSLPLEDAVDLLVAEANDTGGPDNITIVCVKVQAAGSLAECVGERASATGLTGEPGLLEGKETENESGEFWLAPAVLAFFLILAAILYWILG